MSITRSPKPSLQQCSICLDDFLNQEIGIPEHCQHAFCYSCLIDWTKNENTCPLDRQRFQCILRKISFSSRKPYAKLNITDGKLEAFVEENDVTCELCDDNDQECALLTCDECRSNYHLFCLNSFDAKTWICPSCGYTHGRRAESVNSSLMIRQTKARIRRTLTSRDEDRTCCTTKPHRRLQQSNSPNVSRRTANIHLSKNMKRNQPSVRSVATHRESTSGRSSQISPRSAVLISQARNMADLKLKRKRFGYLPARLSTNQLPRIQRRADVPSRPRPKAVIPKSSLPANASFIDKLLHAQNHLISLGNVRMQGAHIQLS